MKSFMAPIWFASFLENDNASRTKRETRCRSVLSVRFRNLCPQSLGTLAAAITHVQGNHLARYGIHGDPNPLLVGLLLDKAGHFIRFHLQASNHDVAVTGDRLDVEMIWQCPSALDQKA